MTDLPNKEIQTEENTVSLSPSSEKEDASSEDVIVLERYHHQEEHKHIKSVSASGKIKYRKKKHHKRKHSGKPKSKHSRLKKFFIGLLIFFLIAVIALFTAYQITRYLGRKELLGANKNASIQTIDNAESEENGQVVYYKGEKYIYNEDLISIVFMGVDQSELGADVAGKAGQADAIYIFTYDTRTDKCCLIPVSRETMTDVRLYSVSGAEMELEKMQLCLAYAYGNGKETSCENTLASLSRIFYNIPFHNYISLNWDSIIPLNDEIGGVRLRALEDIRTDTSSIIKGNYITLMGDDAWTYVKYRDTSKLKSNENRLSRQKQYINHYISKLIPMAKKDFTIIGDLTNIANQYMYSNITTNKLIYIVSEILPTVYSSKDFDFVTIKGSIKKGENYAEFYPDETSLYEAILKVFYNKQTNE